MIVSGSSWQRILFPGLLLFGLSLPLSKSASTVLLVALYLAAGAAALFSKEFRADVVRSCRQPLTAALALFCLVAYAGIIHTENYADGFSVANKFASMPAIYFFVSVLLQSDRSEDARTRKAELLLFSFLAGLTALNLLGALTFLGVFGDAAAALPLAPKGMHHIWFANINALGIYAAVSLLLFSRHGKSARARAFLCGFLLLSSLGVLLSISRAAWFGIVITSLILAVVLIEKKTQAALVVLLAVLTLASVYRFVPLVRDRINLAASDIARFAVEESAESSTGDRLLMWRAALLMFKAHPLAGVGTGDFESSLRPLKRARLVPTRLFRFNQPHNMFLYAMATNGIAGLAALLLIFYRILRFVSPLIRSDGGEKLFAFLALATAVHFMIAGCFDSFFHIQIMRFSFVFILGVCVRSPGVFQHPGPHPPSHR